MTLTEGFMAGNSDRECTWLVNGIAVNPDGPVNPGCNTFTIGTLREIAVERHKAVELANENRLLKEHVAERNAIIERLKAENDRLKYEAVTSQAYARVKVFGEARTEPITGTAEELVARGFLAPVTVGNALIQPTSMRIELPGCVVITIPHPKD